MRAISRGGPGIPADATYTPNQTAVKSPRYVTGTHKFLNSIKIVTLPTAGTYNDAYKTRVSLAPVHRASRESRKSKHLFADVRLEVLVCSDVHADAAVLEPRGAHLVGCARDGGDDDIRLGEARLERERAWVHDVVRVVPPRRRGRAFRVFLFDHHHHQSSWKHKVNGRGAYLDGVDVDRKDACAVVREQRGKRSSNDLRSVKVIEKRRTLFICLWFIAFRWGSGVPVDNCDSLPICAVTVWQDAIVHADIF